MKTNRKLKGMTLIEVVVSIGVYAVIGLLITEIMTLVNATMKATNQLNRRLSYEAKFADNLLLSDGASTFDNEQIHITISGDGANSFTIDAGGFEYSTNANNMSNNVDSSDPSKLIINSNTNYRFMVFPKAYSSSAAGDPNFMVNVIIEDGVDKTVNPVSKMIVNALDLPRNGFRRPSDLDGDVIKSLLMVDSSLYSDDFKTSEMAKNVYDDVVSANLIDSSRQYASILSIPVPCMQADGTRVLNVSNPTAAVRGHIEVLVYQPIPVGSSYCDWTSSEDQIVTKIKNQAVVDGYRVDVDGFPASCVLDLDFLMSAPNPNTGEMTHYDSVNFRWNPTVNPDLEYEEVDVLDSNGLPTGEKVKKYYLKAENASGHS